MYADDKILENRKCQNNTKEWDLEHCQEIQEWIDTAEPKKIFGPNDGLRNRQQSFMDPVWQTCKINAKHINRSVNIKISKKIHNNQLVKKLNRKINQERNVGKKTEFKKHSTFLQKK